MRRTPNKKSNSIEGCETVDAQIRGVSIVHSTDIGWGVEAAAVTEQQERALERWSFETKYSGPAM